MKSRREGCRLRRVRPRVRSRGLACEEAHLVKQKDPPPQRQDLEQRRKRTSNTNQPHTSCGGSQRRSFTATSPRTSPGLDWRGSP